MKPLFDMPEMQRRRSRFELLEFSDDDRKHLELGRFAAELMVSGEISCKALELAARDMGILMDPNNLGMYIYNKLLKL